MNIDNNKGSNNPNSDIVSFLLSSFKHDETKEEAVNPRKIEGDVKSTAVVKYSTVEAPAMFTRLQCNTNLNLPPSNWLSNSTEPYGLQRALSGQRSGFSSFHMAHMFPDCVGAVDVVSDAENIKKLLKISYSRGAVSMMVHRIENTLLIDEFDFHKYLLREAESQWEWFKKFFIEHMMPSSNLKTPHHNNRTALQQKSLVSKFLYHSLVVADPTEKKKTEEPVKADPGVPIPLPYKDAEPSLPEPTLEEELPDPKSDHKFSRNVVWTFEDIQMLLGTDLPIFGGGTHPCISLRLRDMTKPINVLTGIDYWLDNLMCNVPEVVMCYHLNGIVQRYELIKTEDLPHLENSKFSPKVVRDIAQHILSFLKANATKAGHTYWLFKGKDDDVVKLYDLSSLCTEALDEMGQTPFTVPVAMLLYRVARNLFHCRESESPRQNATIRMLLKNCLSLLTAQKYPQFVTSAHYMLADLYIPSYLDPASADLTSSWTEPDPEQEQNESEIKEEWVKELCLSSVGEPLEDLYIPPAPPLASDLETRCAEALQHVVEGLQSLKFLNDIVPEAEEQEPQMAKTDETIPMPYQSLEKVGDKKRRHRKKNNKEKTGEEVKSLLCKSKAEAVPSWKKKPNGSWSTRLKALLHKKACLVYATLFEKSFTNKDFGTALRYASMVLKVREALRKVKTDGNEESYLLCRAGDALFMAVRDSPCMNLLAKHYLTRSETDKLLEETLDGVVSDVLPANLGNLEEMMLSSRKCYTLALECSVDVAEQKNIQKKLGNIENELGALYMSRAEEQHSKEEQGVHGSSDKWFYESLKHLEAALNMFNSIQDELNAALVHSNTGRLMRMRAHHICGNGHFTVQGRKLYDKAIGSYQRAMNLLRDRRHSNIMWDLMSWEMSTVLMTFAGLLENDRGELDGGEQAERECIDLLHRALKHCVVDLAGHKYRERCPQIHHRLASFCHKSLKSCEDEARKRRLLLLCRVHYEKAAKMFEELEQHNTFLLVQMERSGLAQHLAKSSNGSRKLRHWQTALDLLLECRATISKLSAESAEADEENSKVLCMWLEQMLRILLSLSKSEPQTPKTKESAAAYKAMYGAFLMLFSNTSSTASERASSITSLLDQSSWPAR